MGYTIGMPSLKLSNIEGKGGKHCGNFGKVAKEALGERQGLDMDINPELAHKNIYAGFATAEELIAYSENHINELNEWRAEHGERACDKRKLKKDTVVMCATVIKPPAEMMSELSDEQQHQFLQDSLEIFKGFVGEENIKAAAFHFDERVPHLHIFWEPMTDEHRICAKEMHSLKFFGKLNREMPQQLRLKGWSMIDDCQAYDKAEEEQKRLEMGEEKYKEYRKAQKANRGRDSRRFKHEIEKEIAEKEKELDGLVQAAQVSETKTVKTVFGKTKTVQKTPEEMEQDRILNAAKTVLDRETKKEQRLDEREHSLDRRDDECEKHYKGVEEKLLNWHTALTEQAEANKEREKSINKEVEQGIQRELAKYDEQIQQKKETIRQLDSEIDTKIDTIEDLNLSFWTQTDYLRRAERNSQYFTDILEGWKKENESSIVQSGVFIPE